VPSFNIVVDFVYLRERFKIIKMYELCAQYRKYVTNLLIKVQISRSRMYRNWYKFNILRIYFGYWAKK